jgi:hypothetical protein
MAVKVLRSLQIGGYTYEERMNTCGKAGCKKCPHGPYWYRTIKLRSGVKITDYLGRKTPEEIQQFEADAKLAQREWKRAQGGLFQ